jgi:membrane protein YqaA with SNARE-associated domain
MLWFLKLFIAFLGALLGGVVLWAPARMLGRVMDRKHIGWDSSEEMMGNIFGFIGLVLGFVIAASLLFD